MSTFYKQKKTKSYRFRIKTRNQPETNSSNHQQPNFTYFNKVKQDLNVLNKRIKTQKSTMKRESDVQSTITTSLKTENNLALPYQVYEKFIEKNNIDLRYFDQKAEKNTQKHLSMQKSQKIFGQTLISLKQETIKAKNKKRVKTQVSHRGLESINNEIISTSLHNNQPQLIENIFEEKEKQELKDRLYKLQLRKKKIMEEYSQEGKNEKMSLNFHQYRKGSSEQSLQKDQNKVYTQLEKQLLKKIKIYQSPELSLNHKEDWKY